jgi:hypothetical protein
MIWIWIILIAIIAVVSFILALKSMKDFQEIPADELGYSLFLIRNRSGINAELLTRILHQISDLKSHISFERLFKGGEEALVMYAPVDFIKDYPELDSLEIENYLPNKDFVTSWVIKPKKEAEVNISQMLFEGLNLEEMQQFFFQIVAGRSVPGQFQTTIRSMVVEKDPVKRINLAKTIEENLKQNSGLTKSDINKPSGVVYEDFSKRSIIPKEVEKFSLGPNKILELLS